MTAIRLKKGDEVIGMEVVEPGSQLLVVTEQGFGKRTPLDDFPVKHRATGGVIANSLNRDTGDVAAVRLVGREDEEMMLITEVGTILRTEVVRHQPIPPRLARRDGHEARATSDRIVCIAVFVDNRPAEELSGTRAGAEA